MKYHLYHENKLRKPKTNGAMPKVVCQNGFSNQTRPKPRGWHLKGKGFFRFVYSEKLSKAKLQI